MKPKITDCYKFTLTHKWHRVFQYLIAASVSIFWVLTASNASNAQINPAEQHKSDFQLGLGGLLPVPESPLPNGQKKLDSQIVPPPPDGSMGIVTPLVPTIKAVQQTPTDEMKQMENLFIQQQISGGASSSRSSPKKVVRNQKQTAKLATGTHSASDLGSGLVDVASGSDTQQAAPYVAQEFTAPGTPTFNQLLKSQPEVAPLPPLPGTPPSTTAATPTFNQLFNQGGTGFPTTPTNQLTQRDLAPYSQPANSPSPLIDNPAIPPRQQPSLQPRPLIANPALREPYLRFQGVYITQGGDNTARARLEGVYPLTPQVLVGGTLDLTTDNSTLVDSRGRGLNINELYVAASPFAGLPNLRFVAGQLDLTSYFDRNSFAKDGASQFFNPVFQTNPALAATGIASRTGLLVNWSATDNIEAKAAVFSSADKISSFALDGFAGEIGFRYGNAIIRGTYATDRDAGIRDSFPESFSIPRNSARTAYGPLKDDREEAYGLNTEVYIPNLKLGLFGRYGRYQDRDLGKGADTYSFGATLLDLFTQNDRVGLAYGRSLSNDSLRRGKYPDVLELYYDFQVLPYVRLGFTVQGRDGFEETVLGVRVRTEFDVTRGKGR